jgi:hypothetical protein
MASPYKESEEAEHTQDTSVPNTWDILASLAGSVDAPEDWANQHDHYLYGTPKSE